MLQNPIKIWKVHENTVDTYKTGRIMEWRKFFLDFKDCMGVFHLKLIGFHAKTA